MRAAVVCVVLAACTSSGGGATRTSSPDGASAGVVVKAEGTWLEGVRVADAPPERTYRIAGLFDALTRAREAWKRAHAGELFPGAMRVTFATTPSCGAALGVLQTMAFAGYTNLTVEVGGARHDLRMALPGPPDPLDPTRAAPVEVHVLVRPDGAAAVRMNACMAAYDTVPVARVGGVLAEMGVADVAGLRVACEGGVMLPDVLAVYDAARPALAKDTTSYVAGLIADAGCTPGAGRLSAEVANGFPRFDPFAEGDPHANANPWSADDPLGTDPFAHPGPEPIRLPEGFTGDLRVGALAVTGAVTDKAVTAGVDVLKPELLGCYAVGLAKDRALRGGVTIEMRIGKTGGVVAFGAVKGDLRDNDVIACMRRRLVALALAPAGPGTARVPFVLAVD